MVRYEMRSNALANVVKQRFHQAFHINKPTDIRVKLLASGKKGKGHQGKVVD